MVLIDSSVWIDCFRDVSNAHTDQLDALLGFEPLVTGDLVVTEVLQGFRNDAEFHTAKRLLETLPLVTVAGPGVAIRAASNFRKLRRIGITIRSTVDTLIATRCIESGFHLLHKDRDFDAFERHLGLRSVISSH